MFTQMKETEATTSDTVQSIQQTVNALHKVGVVISSAWFCNFPSKWPAEGA